jgi:phosphate transport system permease protein
MTAIILGTARGIGETSPVLLTAGATTNFNLNPFEGPMTSLPLLTFGMTKSPEAGFVARGFGAATVLMLLVLVLFVVARLLGGRAPGDLSKRQRRRRSRQSAEDLRYYELLAASDVRRAPGATAAPEPKPAPTTPSDEVTP